MKILKNVILKYRSLWLFLATICTITACQIFHQDPLPRRVLIAVTLLLTWLWLHFVGSPWSRGSQSRSGRASDVMLLLASIAPVAELDRAIVATSEPDKKAKMIEEFLRRAEDCGLYSPRMATHPQEWHERGNWDEKVYPVWMNAIGRYYANWADLEAIKKTRGEPNRLAEVRKEAQALFAKHPRQLPEQCR